MLATPTSRWHSCRCPENANETHVSSSVRRSHVALRCGTWPQRAMSVCLDGAISTPQPYGAYKSSRKFAACSGCPLQELTHRSSPSISFTSQLSGRYFWDRCEEHKTWLVTERWEAASHVLAHPSKENLSEGRHINSMSGLRAADSVTQKGKLLQQRPVLITVTTSWVRRFY